MTYATNSKHANREMETHLLNKFFNVANTELVIAVYADDIVTFFPSCAATRLVATKTITDTC